ncbi:GNAT family N-acetyltransferase [Breznakiella homolactica]|uniref:Leucyl-tRNA--protein transferase n=1 Tax=Breznakiella homolactica TaxID=2798577 RepID=A0A7T8B9X4_9SPIR|nr:GNAT family N-acetyltransferase [Breznakiella homolactica]QQO10069.1 GNAT family N-acetyltransferase [Breznakiella homolactica]
MACIALRFTASGHIFTSPEDDPEILAAALTTIPYEEEFCISLDFDPGYIAALMAAGFMVMSMEQQIPGYEPETLLLPKLHRERSVVFFPELHAGKTARRLIPRYELNPEENFETVLRGCAETHGEDWLTPELQRSFGAVARRDDLSVRMRTFGLYRNGRLAAGEFGVSIGGVYTSYSGFFREPSAGTVQMVMTGRFLEQAGYAFWDLGMPLEYKYSLGARTLDRERFMELFRDAREAAPPIHLH